MFTFLQRDFPFKKWICFTIISIWVGLVTCFSQQDVVEVPVASSMTQGASLSLSLSLCPSFPLSKLPLPQAQLVCWRRRHRCRGSRVGSVTPNLDQQNWPADPQTCAQKQMFIIVCHCKGWLSCSNILAINNGYRQ